MDWLAATALKLRLIIGAVRRSHTRHKKGDTSSDSIFFLCRHFPAGECGREKLALGRAHHEGIPAVVALERKLARLCSSPNAISTPIDF